MTHIKTFIVYVFSFISVAAMEVLKMYTDFGVTILQLIIGVLTIIYLIKKIKRK